MDDLNARVRQLEALVDHLYAALNVERPAPAPASIWDSQPAYDDGVSAGVRELARRGEKIHAIKLYREETGCDLRTAKNVIDGLT